MKDGLPFVSGDLKGERDVLILGDGDDVTIRVRFGYMPGGAEPHLRPRAGSAHVRVSRRSDQRRRDICYGEAR